MNLASSFKMSVDIKVERLLVSPFFYDIMVNGENEFVEVVDGVMTYKGYPVVVSDEVKDLEFIYDVGTSMEKESQSNIVEPHRAEETPEEVVYKLRHKSSGLFLDPQGCTTNVSVRGKTYNKKPPRQRFWGIPYELRGQFKENYCSTELSDWEVVEYHLSEVSVVDKGNK